jgi:clan AA aspartic protease (TIGR02281 family)
MNRHGKLSTVDRCAKRFRAAVQPCRHLVLACFCLILLPLLTVSFAQAENVSPESLKAQIEALLEQHNIKAAGLHLIGQASPVPTEGDLESRIDRLLEGYNYVLLRDSRNGVVEKLIVSRVRGARRARGSRVSVRTTRRGSGHFVATDIVGQGAGRKKVSLLVDTGAAFIVLPASMKTSLGYDGLKLTKTSFLTANGPVEGEMAVLRTVAVGKALINDVAVAFIDDELLGFPGLLGMSFLKRFVTVIDDNRNEVTLERRP